MHNTIGKRFQHKEKGKGSTEKVTKNDCEVHWNDAEIGIQHQCADVLFLGVSRLVGEIREKMAHEKEYRCEKNICRIKCYRCIAVAPRECVGQQEYEITKMGASIMKQKEKVHLG